MRVFRKAQLEIVTLCRMMILKAKEIALVTGGTVIGDENAEIQTVAKLNEGNSDALGFFANLKYESQVYDTRCGIIFIPKNFQPSKEVHPTLIAHDNPYFAFCQILQAYFNPNVKKVGIHPQAYIHPSAEIGENAYVGPFAFIGENVQVGSGAQIHERVSIADGCRIGNEATLFPGVTIYSKTQIGDRFTAHAGSVIGSDGFGFAPVNGAYMKIPQVGIVEIEDDVEIGSNCCIDRATMGKTLIKKGTKLDNLVQIAHNVEIGEHVVVASQAGIAGSTTIGHHCVFGGQVGVAGHITIAPMNSFGGQAGVTGSIKESNQKMTGTPAMDVNAYLRGVVGAQKVSQLQKEIKQLKREIDTLKSSHE